MITFDGMTILLAEAQEQGSSNIFLASFRRSGGGWINTDYTPDLPGMKAAATTGVAPDSGMTVTTTVTIDNVPVSAGFVDPTLSSIESFDHDQDLYDVDTPGVMGSTLVLLDAWGQLRFFTQNGLEMALSIVAPELDANFQQPPTSESCEVADRFLRTLLEGNRKETLTYLLPEVPPSLVESVRPFVNSVRGEPEHTDVSQFACAYNTEDPDFQLEIAIAPFAERWGVWAWGYQRGH
ncbi:MAG: hypothetical protein ACRDK3_10240 [Actinomycetota bacterium]